MPNFDPRHAPDALKEVSYATAEGKIRTMHANDQGLLKPQSREDEQVLDSFGYTRAAPTATKSSKRASKQASANAKKATASAKATRRVTLTSSDKPDDVKLAETKGSDDASE